jgi:hypothetical protein
VGTQSGSLYKVQNAESNPSNTDITGTNFPLASISSIDIGQSEDTLVVTFSNYGVTSVFKSNNGGQTWRNAEGNLPDMPIRWCLLNPASSKNALLATETGVWTTSNLDESTVAWTPVNTGMGNVRVDMLTMRESDNTVLAATHGRGLFTCTWDLSTGICPATLSAFKVYPDPVQGIATIDIGGEQLKAAVIKVISMEGKVVYTTGPVSSVSGLQKIDLSSLASGVYYIGIYEEGKSIRSSKIIKE